MKLTERQNDALNELLNIAFSRTADSLSKITGQRVLIEAPRVELLELQDLAALMKELEGHQVAAVDQSFDGDFAGEAILIFDHTAALSLANLLSPGTIAKDLTTSSMEVLTEVGNILLTSCIAMFGNVLKVRIGFAVPRLQVARLNAILDRISGTDPDRRRALVAFTSFRLEDSSIRADIVIVLGINSMDELVNAVGALG